MAKTKSDNTPLRAVGYCRTSGEGQRDNTSIPNQKLKIQEFCERNGWQLVTFYVDESKTGSKIAGRDDFQRMMLDATKGNFSIVVVLDIKRFSRSGLDTANASETLKRLNICVLDTKGKYDTRSYRNAFINYVYPGRGPEGTL